jgi:hypothetical protein
MKQIFARVLNKTRANRLIFYLLVTAAATRASAATAATTAAAETAATRAASAATATAAASAVPAAAVVSFIDLQLSATQVFAIQPIKGCLCLILRRHLDKTESSRFAAELILYYADRPNLAVCLKSLPQQFFRHFSCQITYINVHLKNPQNKN